MHKILNENACTINMNCLKICFSHKKRVECNLQDKNERYFNVRGIYSVTRAQNVKRCQQTIFQMSAVFTYLYDRFEIRNSSTQLVSNLSGKHKEPKISIGLAENTKITGKIFECIAVHYYRHPKRNVLDRIVYKCFFTKQLFNMTIECDTRFDRF